MSTYTMQLHIIIEQHHVKDGFEDENRMYTAKIINSILGCNFFLEFYSAGSLYQLNSTELMPPA